MILQRGYEFRLDYCEIFVYRLKRIPESGGFSWKGTAYWGCPSAIWTNLVLWTKVIHCSSLPRKWWHRSRVLCSEAKQISLGPHQYRILVTTSLISPFLSWIPIDGTHLMAAANGDWPTRTINRVSFLPSDHTVTTTINEQGFFGYSGEFLTFIIEHDLWLGDAGTPSGLNCLLSLTLWV